MLYHHCRSLDSITYGEVRANPKYFDPDFKDAYIWLKEEIGFCPLFLAIGTTNDDILMTGYANQWRRIISEGPNGKEYRKKGEFPNNVLFSFEEVDGVFTDYGYWHLALGSYRDNITDYEKRLIFKPSWPKSKWLRNSKKRLQSVQLVTPRLYLPDAKRIWVRNKQTQKVLERMGFDNIKVKRIPIN